MLPASPSDTTAFFHVIVYSGWAASKAACCFGSHELASAWSSAGPQTVSVTAVGAAASVVAGAVVWPPVPSLLLHAVSVKASPASPATAATEMLRRILCSSFGSSPTPGGHPPTLA